MLRVASVSNAVWRVSDFASDKLVLELASADTVAKLANLLDGTEDSQTIAVLVSVLLQMRLHLFGVNADGISARVRVTLVWVSMCILTSTQGVFLQ